MSAVFVLSHSVAARKLSSCFRFICGNMEPILPAFIDIDEHEQAQELRTFLRDNGANIPEESKTPLQDELDELIGACDLCFKSEADFEGTMNSFLSLILMVTEKRDYLIRMFCSKIADGRAEESISQATLRVLNILLNGLHEQDPVRYDVYCTQLEVAGRAGLIELIPTSLDKIKGWLKLWAVDAGKTRKLYRLLHDALKDDKQSEEASKVMVELLNTYTDENASEAKEDAQHCIVSFLAKPNVLIMDHLFRLRPVAALEGEPIHRLLTIFISGRLNDYTKFREANEGYVESLGLSHETNMKKMRILTFMSVGAEKSEISFEELAKTVDINIDDVEGFVIDALHSQLIRARIDQVHQKVIVSSVTQRTFSMEQWQCLRAKLEEWRQNLSSVGTSLHTVIPPTVMG